MATMSRKHLQVAVKLELSQSNLLGSSWNAVGKSLADGAGFNRPSRPRFVN